VAARRAPQVSDSSAPLHTLPDTAFVKGIQSRYGGIPETIMKDAELMTLFTPVLRANFTMIETYQYRHEEPLDLPIAAFGGTRDKTTNETELSAWGRQSKRSFNYQMFDGDHFFIQQHQSSVLDTIKRNLKPFLA
jgi:medium-chain acyl-[acyl-carrier-protein] hydrolase